MQTDEQLEHKLGSGLGGSSRSGPDEGLAAAFRDTQEKRMHVVKVQTHGLSSEIPRGSSRL